MHSKFRIPRRLNRLGNDAVTNAQSIEDELSAVRGAIGNQLILVVKIVVKSRSIMLDKPVST